MAGLEGAQHLGTSSHLLKCSLNMRDGRKESKHTTGDTKGKCIMPLPVIFLRYSTLSIANSGVILSQIDITLQKQNGD